MGVFQDLTHRTFGQLYVIEYAGKSNTNSIHKVHMWLCECSCGNREYKRAGNLLSGHTVCCTDCSKKRKAEHRRRPSKCEIVGDVAYITTKNGDVYMVDASDVDLVSGRCWRKNTEGYAVTDMNKKQVRMHRLILDCPSGEMVDHISGDKHDNRRCNLRVVTNSQNQMNRALSSNNTSGVKGVSWDSHRLKWTAHICVNNQVIPLGRFDEFEDACAVRKQAEMKYHGVYSYAESQEIASKFKG